MTETGEDDQTIEALQEPEVAIKEYATQLVALLDIMGDDYSGFPGKQVDSLTEEGHKRRIIMGVTEPYPKRSPRFGAIMDHSETRDEHLVISDSILDNSRASFTTEYDEVLGYAVTNVRTDEPSRLFVSDDPRYPGSWRRLDESDGDFPDHLAKFMELTGKVVSEFEVQVDQLGQRRQKAGQELERAHEQHARSTARDQKEQVKRTTKLGMSPGELDELHADQARLVSLIDSLDRRRTITGDKRPRAERLPRREHRAAAERAAHSLETSYGITVNKRGRVAKAVVARVLDEEKVLSGLKTERDTATTESARHQEELRRKAAHTARLKTREAEARAKLEAVK